MTLAPRGHCTAFFPPGDYELTITAFGAPPPGPRRDAVTTDVSPRLVNPDVPGIDERDLDATSPPSVLKVPISAQLANSPPRMAMPAPGCSLARA